MTTPTIEDLDNPMWRICNLYTIRSDEGKPIPFRPNVEQMEVLREIYEYGSMIIVLVKARQLGMSTLMSIICLDTILFRTSIEAGLIDYNSNNAKKKLREKVFYAFDRLHPLIKDCYKVYSRSIQKGEFGIGPVWASNEEQSGEDQPYSTFYAGETPRGGTFQILWFSEWWETAARFHQRSEDILTAGWPAGEQGLRVIETTVHGGKKGAVWTITKQGLGPTGEPLPRNLRTPKTPVVMFFPWWKKKKYREEGSPELVRSEMVTYFEGLSQQLDVEFDHEQMLWYQKQWDTYGAFVKGQYPSTIHECWESPVLGAIWAEALANAKLDGRVGDFPHNPDYEVNTFWDLGAPENTRTSYVQHLAGKHFIIDHDGEMKLTLKARVAHLKAKGYRFGTHFLPHDAGSRMKNGISLQAEFEAELLAQDVPGRVVVLKVTQNKWLGINSFESMIRTCVYINSEPCAVMMEDMDLYRRMEDKKMDGKFTDEIVKANCEHSCLDGDTLIDTDHGEIPIKLLTTSHKVKLGDSWGEIEWVGPTKVGDVLEITFSDGSTLLASPEHKIFTSKGLVRCDALSYMSDVCTKHHPTLTSRNLPNIREQFWTHPSDLTAGHTTLTKRQDTTVGLEEGSIKQFGGSIMDLYLRVWTSIIRIQTRLITTLKISRCFQLPSTALCMQGPVSITLLAEPQRISINIATEPPYGTKAQKGTHGTWSTQKPVSFTSQRTRNVHSVRKYSRLDQGNKSSVQLGVNAGFALVGRMNQRSVSAPYALLPLDAVQKAPRSTVPKNATPHLSVLSVRSVTGARQLYDMTVKDHHCYVANGVLVSNCDSLRYIAEADLAGHLPSTSNGIMTNLYFDAPTIQELTRTMTEHRAGVWNIEYQGNADFRRITARRDDSGGWLRVWEDPVVGRSYIVSLTNGAVCVWRQSFWDAQTGRELPAVMAAACVDETGIHAGNLYQWAAMAAAHYGDAPICLDITSLPGGVEGLKAVGAGVMARRQSLSDRRVGQQSPEIRKYGHEFGTDERLEAYGTMQVLFRDQKAALYCPVTLRQMMSIIIGDAGTPDLLEGAKEHWVRASALALWNIGQAGPMRRPMVSSLPIDYGGSSGQRNGRRKLA